MKLYIDNLDVAGPRDYTQFLSGGRGPVIRRKLNHPDELEATLLSESQFMLMPIAGARVQLVRDDGSKLFTGYLTEPLRGVSLGDSERGPWYSYVLKATGDEALLDHRPLPARPNYARVTAGQLLEDLAEELCPGAFETSGLGDGGTVVAVSCGGARRWSDIAQQLANQTRCACRVHDHAITLRPVESLVHVLNENDPALDNRKLQAEQSGTVVNKATVLSGNEPDSYVNDQFVGDGYMLVFSLSNYPYLRTPQTVLEEEFTTSLAPYLWDVKDTAGALQVQHGQLSTAGGTGDAEACSVTLQQAIELGGAWQFQHGELAVDSGSGWIGGLFDHTIDAAHCIAGFRVTDSGGQRNIQPLINGTAVGTVVTARAGCRYALSTRLYGSDHFRLHSSFCSPAGILGGQDTATSMRVVLECREIDPANPATFAQPATALFDDLITRVPSTCLYVPVASENLHASLNFLRIRRMPEVLVRSALQGQPFRTRLVGALSEGAECGISTSGDLYFYSVNPPAPNESIVVTYRTAARAAGSASDAESIANLVHVGDDGVRASVASLVAPVARSSEDCVLAAQAWLSASKDGGWSGEYSCWRDSLPLGTEIFPGDAVSVVAPSRDARFSAIIRDVQIDVEDLIGEREWIRFHFADDGADAFAMQLSREQDGYEWPRIVVDATAPPALDPLSNAKYTAITSTTLMVDAGIDPPAGGGIEVRRSDSGWSPDIDRNLAGRFTSRTFTLPRLARNQQYCFRQYDGSNPPRYSRHTTILYVDLPL
jgi:hypothetical protein